MKIKEEMKKYIKKYFEFINESENTYTEIEFVCYNTDGSGITDPIKQKEFYKYLKNSQYELDGDIITYMQNFSDKYHKEKSLAVVILNKNEEKSLKKKILDIAKKFDIKIDLYNKVDDRKVDDIVRKTLENIIKR